MFLLGASVGLVIGVVVGVAVAARRSHPHALDTLTGVGSRASGQAALDQLDIGDAVAMIDLDTLKSTNDTRGHAAGDELLVSLAHHLSNGVRQGDAVARWGGDEFLVVLRGSGAAAVGVIDRLRCSYDGAFSAGVAVHAGGDPASTLAAADAALLRAKGSGGASVVEA